MTTTRRDLTIEQDTTPGASPMQAWRDRPEIATLTTLIDTWPGTMNLDEVELLARTLLPSSAFDVYRGGSHVAIIARMSLKKAAYNVTLFRVKEVK